MYKRKTCNHCNNPACASACLTKAMLKTEEGPVIWREEKCMGCRSCMISCPFGIPKFDYHSSNPKIQKCRMCFERLQEGQLPVCVENCPAGAVFFGKRRDLIEIARERIYKERNNHNQIEDQP
jgi:Fe-S-cluster-containing dehydrogenase component